MLSNCKPLCSELQDMPTPQGTDVNALGQVVTRKQWGRRARRTRNDGFSQKERALRHGIPNVAASPAASGILSEVNTLRFHSDLFWR